ncbi:type II secretion protein [Iodidimonas gelatinilytica]|uniref:Type II secretion protein n=1 Tax=Iodidimonas gelatinilytica TaxID=1236966 RepID=A0A5A7MWS0_9PROT|nr:ATPase, T2SS/T4P/T4SS family [Iodidimonas gelatinilytica]GEQ99015.1 type II secretion protein [Iodidimonas gelatinilytica]GEQ99783.1 type II secretion protein [Iodidimonas gelatinilytica]
MDHRRIGDILAEQGLITAQDRAQADAFQREVGGLFGQALVRLGAISETDLLAALSQQLDLPVLTAATAPDAAACIAASQMLDLPPSWITQSAAPIWCLPADPENSDEDHLWQTDVICAAPRNSLDPDIMELLESRCKNVRYFLAPNAMIDSLLSHHDRNGDKAGVDDEEADAARLREMAEEAPVIDFVNTIFSQALQEGASDIHIEPSEHMFQVRSRIDGVLHIKSTQPRRRFDAVVSRVKLLSGMDIAERRLPQDGRQTIRVSGEDVDLRVSSLPTSWGEGLVLRLLRKQRTLLDLSGLGLRGRARSVLDGLLRENHGIILVTGPTGSGKSTTLYRALETVNDGIRKIITIEDPVEYDMEGVSQIQTKAEIGYDFARGLRAILRQDPDVIMVGEIRDGETAAIAAQAALTGHLVLSTLHTNSALAAIPRLVDLGLEPFLVASALLGTAAQRLVRRLCPHCAMEETDKARITEQNSFIERLARDCPALAQSLTGNKARWRTTRGCDACSNTGYLGRLALFEIAAIDGALADAISQGQPLGEMTQLARKRGFMTLLEDGAEKARAGETTLQEVMRVVGASVMAE